MPVIAVAPLMAVSIAGLIGLCIGSFLNVVIHRLPKMLDRGWRAQCAELAGEPAADLPRYNLMVPRSQCPACGHRISALENIPCSHLSPLPDMTTSGGLGMCVPVTSASQ